MDKKTLQFKKITCFIFLFATLFFSASSAIGQVTCGAGFEVQAGVCVPTETGLPSSDVKTIVTNLMNWLLALVAIIAIIAFTISGLQYMLSTGDEKMIDTAKRNMTWSIVGVIVALSGMIIITAVNKFLIGVSPDF